MYHGNGTIVYLHDCSFLFDGNVLSYPTTSHLWLSSIFLTIIILFAAYSGLVGRNGTGKTTFLRHLAMHAIDGIPKNRQILHVEQEVVGDDTIALQCVLNSDIERTQLLEEEAFLLAQQVA